MKHHVLLIIASHVLLISTGCSTPTIDYRIDQYLRAVDVRWVDSPWQLQVWQVEGNVFPLLAGQCLVAVGPGAPFGVRTLNDLTDQVKLDNEKAALEFVRLFSRQDLWHLQQNDMVIVEVTKGTKGPDEIESWQRDIGELPPQAWSDLKLHEPRIDVQIQGDSKHFTIIRFAINDFGELLRIEESVSHNGSYKLLSHHKIAEHLDVVAPILF